MLLASQAYVLWMVMDHTTLCLKGTMLCRSNKVAKFFASVLLIGLAGGAAVFIKQEMDKSRKSDAEILIVDKEIDEDTLESQ